MTFYPARVLLKFTSPRFQRLFSSSNNEGAGGQKPGSHMGTFDWDTTHINSDGFSSASNAKYMEFLYAKWIKDNKSIHESWQKFFSKLEDDQEKPKRNSSITKKSTSQKNLNPNPLECNPDYGSEKKSFDGPTTNVPMPLVQYSIEDGRGSFGFTPIPGHKNVKKPNADKEGVRRPDKSEKEKRRRSPKSEPGQPPISKFEETEVHYFPMPDVWNPSNNVDFSETSFIPASPSSPKLEPTNSVKEPDSYDNCEATSSFDEILKNIEMSQKKNIISRKLSQDTTSKEPSKNIASKDLKSLKGPSKMINPPKDLTKPTSLKSEKGPQKPNYCFKEKTSPSHQSPTLSKENLDVSARKSYSQRIVQKTKTPKSMDKAGNQHKLPKAPPNPSKKNDYKEVRSPKRDDPKNVKTEDLVEVSPDASIRNLRQPLKFPEKPTKTDKPEIKVDKKMPPRKGFIKPASQPDITLPPRKKSSSIEESPLTEDKNNKNATETEQRTYKRNLLEKVLRRLGKNPKTIPQDELPNRRSFKSIEEYMEPKVFDGIEQLIKDLKTMPWAGTPQQRRLDTMKRLQNYNNSLKSANEKLRRLANERNKAFMKCVLAHRQSLVGAKPKRIKKDNSKCSESPSLKATLRDSPRVFEAPERLFQEELDNSPRRLGLTEREKIILFDQNQKATSALKSSLKKLEENKSKGLMGKVKEASIKEIPSLETKEQKDKPEDKPQP